MINPFFFPHDPRISMAMHRIRDAFIKYKPPSITFTDEKQGSFTHCIHWVGQNPEKHTERDEGIFERETLPESDSYIVFAHIGNPHYKDQEGYYQRLLEYARLVITFDKDIIGYEGDNVFETPWGFEPETFFLDPQKKRYKILCTGYMAHAEGIDSCYDAVIATKGLLCHVGGRLRGITGPAGYVRYEGVKDYIMRSLYAKSEYVSGMRREGGFELPTIEGYACGAQPIVFNLPTMRKYYSDFALFVPLVNRLDLYMELRKIFERPANVSPDERILSRFHWETIMNKVWSRVQEVI